MACTLLAHDYVWPQGGRVVALTVDHGLRAESRIEAEQVAARMREHGIEHHILTPSHIPAGNNMLQAARQWRYDALAEWCAAHDVLHCLVAHHADDQRETALLNIARGDTEDGGSGMARVRNYRGVRFMRPLLDASKEDLKQYLRAHAMGWVEDPSNAREEFARVRVRKQLASDADLVATTDTLLRRAHAERSANDHAFAAAAMVSVTIYPAGYAMIHSAQWKALAPAQQSRIIADTLRCISGATQRARGHDIARLLLALYAEKKGKRSLQHCLIEWRDGVIRVMREPSRVAEPIALQGSGRVQWDNRFAVHYTIPDGMKYQLRALGAVGRKQLKSIGLEGAAELPLATPALWHLEELLIVPHIQWRAACAPSELVCRVGFNPAKPLAAAAFW
jgi:tRNA(Ile)-lysidine synthase